MEPIPAVITPIDEHMGLDIARSLGRKGIPVYGFDADPKSPGRYSRYVRFVQGVDPEAQGEDEYIERLARFGKTLPNRAVLFPLSDRHVLTCSRHRTRLEPYFLCVLPDHQVVEGFATKDGLQKLARQYGIPAPKTFPVESRDHLQAVIQEMTFPAILKPTESTYWHTPEVSRLLTRGLLAGRAKVIYCPDAQSLLSAYDRIRILDDRLIVQEVIPGEDGQLVYLAFYLNRDSQPLGLFAGRKHRIIPTGFGSASYVRSYYDPQVVQLGLSLLSQARYQGLVGVEFKRDPRDGLHKLIEVNTRFGMWDGLSVRCGVDLPYIAYRDAVGEPLPPRLSFREDVIWIDWQRDLRAALAYFRSGKLTFKEWVRSVRGEKMWAIYDQDDWRPGVVFTLGLVEKLWKRIALSSDRLVHSHR